MTSNIKNFILFISGCVKECSRQGKVLIHLPYFSIDNARVIYTERAKFVKNEHARYTLGMKQGKNLEKLITATSQARF